MSLAPTKAAVSTSILSKRWEFLWMWLTKLEFGDELYSESEFKSLQCFLDRNLPLHRAPVIESFRLELSGLYFKPEDIRMWVVVVVSRYIRELEIYCPEKQHILPSSLYTCKSLVILKLDGGIILDVPPMVCLPSLRTLELKGYTCDVDEFVIDTPSLEYFKLEDRNYDSHPCLIENMPKLTVAYVDVRSTDLQSLIGSITSVKYLTISSKAMFGDGFIFNHLEHLTLRVWDDYPWNVLVQVLKDSPNLRELSCLSEMNVSSFV
ncbi:unnamed protein product [Arabidopsis thaliana]|uniref:FBD domain-containing protein n=1 Tax=Arabidopsis thaliana TaxID=3702 RepID=A0A5S9XRB0_ARATH|nr:unnamed protein product [Arabidopsis thaliana]